MPEIQQLTKITFGLNLKIKVNQSMMNNILHFKQRIIAYCDSFSLSNTVHKHILSINPDTLQETENNPKNQSHLRGMVLFIFSKKIY